jgi:pimeloyl-ACP methyl ester carboxylesterase
VLLGPEASPALVEPVLAMADETGEARLVAQLRLQATRVDERPALARVQAPTLVVAGADDALCGLDRHEEIHRLVAGSELVVVPEAGHLVTMERPDPVATAMVRWLGRVDAATAGVSPAQPAGPGRPA